MSNEASKTFPDGELSDLLCVTKQFDFLILRGHELNNDPKRFVSYLTNLSNVSFALFFRSASHWEQQRNYYQSPLLYFRVKCTSKLCNGLQYGTSCVHNYISSTNNRKGHVPGHQAPMLVSSRTVTMKLPIRSTTTEHETARRSLCGLLAVVGQF